VLTAKSHQRTSFHSSSYSSSGCRYLWFGYGCSKEEREFTLRIYKAIDQVNPNAVPEIVMEGREDKVMEGREQLAEQSGNEFWNAFTHSKESYVVGRTHAHASTLPWCSRWCRHKHDLTARPRCCRA